MDVEVIPGYPDRIIKIGNDLPEFLRQEITNLRREYSDIFAWGSNDMPGISEVISRHSLHVNPKMHPIYQKKRTFYEEKCAAIDEEINRLLEAEFIKPVKFPTWITNVVLVKKSNRKWGMCIDYSDFNKACPKDYYP